MSTKAFHERPAWVDLILVNGITILVILLIVLGTGCGIITGNPEDRPEGSGDALGATDFETPAQEYASAPTGITNCGSFDNQSTANEIEVGQQCIRDALTDCTPAKYFIDQTNLEGKRFVSFVEVVATGSPPTCSVNIHTV
jgi:hypothetical protein